MSQSVSNFSLETLTECGIRLTEIQEQIAIVENCDPALKLKPTEEPPNPAVNYIQNIIFPTLNSVLKNLLYTIKENDYIHNCRNTFNATDYVAECLWNMNSRYPKRRAKWTYIFDIDWVKKHLENDPRPLYPLSLIWSKNVAAIKIQKYVKDFLVRKTPEVQELRKFCKEERERLRFTKEQNENSITSILKTGLSHY